MRVKDFFARLFSLESESAELLLAALTLSYATIMFDSSSISSDFTRAMKAVFPLSVWFVLGVASSIFLTVSTLASLAFRGKAPLVGRMVGAAGVFVFYAALGYAQTQGGATWALLKHYSILMGWAGAIYVALYLEKHPPTPNKTNARSS